MKNKWALITVICVVVALITGLALWLLLPKKPSPDPVPSPAPTVEKVTITFNADGGEEVEALEVEKGSTKELPSTTKEGYTFEGWYYNEEEVKSDHVFNESITVVAKWKKIEEETKVFKVSFDSKGGSKVSAITLECGKTLTMPKNPTKAGYTFVTWVDKNGKSITSGVKFSCENVTLYAKWEEVKKEEPAKAADPEPAKTVDPEPAKTPDPTPAPEPAKTYKCPSGYTLSGTKCTIEGTVRETCPEGTKVDGTLCINTSDSNGGTRQCKTYTVSIDGKGHTQTVKGDYYMVGNSYGKCAFYKWTSYTTQTDCNNANDSYHKTTWVSELNGCYAETYITFPNGESSYQTVCSDAYQYYSSSELSSKFGIHDNAKCLKKVAKTKYCDEGYTLTSGKCIKTIDATVE